MVEVEAEGLGERNYTPLATTLTVPKTGFCYEDRVPVGGAWRLEEQ